MLKAAVVKGCFLIRVSASSLLGRSLSDVFLTGKINQIKDIGVCLCSVAQSVGAGTGAGVARVASIWEGF